MRIAVFVACLLMSGGAMADTVKLHAAGSLKAALTQVVRDFEAAAGHKVETAFGPSGLLRQRIEKGESAEVFASANMTHPKTLEKAGKAGPVRMFARNKLCAIVQSGVTVSTDTLLDVLLDPKVTVGTSTPKADPSGDYAWRLFAKADKVSPGAEKALDAKAVKLTGGPTSQKAPKGRNQYGWVMENRRADVFLTYCTNAVLAKKEVPGLQIVAVPDALSVGADYGITLIAGASEAAALLADFILGPDGQKVLARFGFDAPEK
ncbi:MAG TPA: molybdate ABC transporter substrate-binding protein [Rhodospirillaceae bacterium]|nr:molybdate ABC transporter substrate-binding protein [Magnetovibrio sp.]HCS68514.1 molybdate ABC transporter substrate-binding protein [Rhodospirillaceae bacterium]|tara:strand:+ start:11888 stop:12676 length:789 start_codon:yes stop_codon:yes gene_type:complete